MTKEGTWGPWNPRPPGPTAGPPSYPHPKIKIHKASHALLMASHHSPVNHQR